MGIAKVAKELLDAGKKAKKVTSKIKKAGSLLKSKPDKALKRTLSHYKDNVADYTKEKLKTTDKKYRQAELKQAQRDAYRAFNRLRKAGYAQGEYYDRLEEALALNPTTKKQEIDKLYTLTDFLANDEVRTVKGMRAGQKAFASKIMGEGYEGKRYDSATAMRFLMWRFPDAKKQVSFADVADNREDMFREMWEWHKAGEPRANTNKRSRGRKK